MQLFFLGVEPDEGQAEKKGHQSKEVDEGVSLHKRRRWEPPTTPSTPSRPRTRRSNPLGRRQPLKAQLPVETTVTNRTPTSETQAFVSSSSCCFLLALTLFFHFHRRLCVPTQLRKKSSWAFVRPALLSYFYDIAHDRSLRRLPFRQLFFILLPCYLLLLLRITPILLLLSVFFVMVFIHQLYSGPSYQQT